LGVAGGAIISDGSVENLIRVNLPDERRKRGLGSGLKLIWAVHAHTQDKIIRQIPLAGLIYTQFLFHFYSGLQEIPLLSE